MNNILASIALSISLLTETAHELQCPSSPRQFVMARRVFGALRELETAKSRIEELAINSNLENLTVENKLDKIRRLLNELDRDQKDYLYPVLGLQNRPEALNASIYINANLPDGDQTNRYDYINQLFNNHSALKFKFDRINFDLRELSTLAPVLKEFK